MNREHTPYPDARAFLEAVERYADDDTHNGNGWTYGREQNRATLRARLMDGTCYADELAAIADLSARCRAEMDALGDIGTTRRRRLIWGEEGAEPDAARYLAGHEDCWLRVQIGKAMPTIRLGVNICLSGGNGDDAFRNVVGRAAALADALTVRGYAVEVRACLPIVPYNGGGWILGPSFPLKCAAEPLDLERIASAGAPGLFRDYCFRWWRANGNRRPYGMCLEAPRELWRTLGVDYMVSTSWTSAGGALQQALQNAGASFED